MLLYFTWPIAAPVYMVWSRGWKRGLLQGTAIQVSLVLLWLVPFVVAGYAVGGADFFRTG